jgi:hypothetical protein
MASARPTQRENAWKWFERVFIVLPTVGVAIVVWWITVGSEHEKTRLEYVRIATTILQQAPKQPDTLRSMREWAVAVLNQTATVKLSPEQIEALIEGTAVLPRSAYEDDNGDYYGGFKGGPGPDEALRELRAYSPSPSPSPR